MRKVLVTGAGGLVGGALLRAARARRLEVVATARAGGEGLLRLDATDLDRAQGVLEKEAPDAVLFAAALPHVEGCERDPAGTRPVNVEAPAAWGERCAALGIPLVCFSTEYVFDGEAEAPYPEDASPRPLNEYGRQKRALELALDGGSHLVVRTSGVYGPHPARKNFVYQLLDHDPVRGPFRVPRDQWITPTFADALASGVLDALALGLRGVLHLAGSDVLARDAFAQSVCAAFDLPLSRVLPVDTEALGLLAPRPPRAGLACRRAKAAGIPLVSVREGLERFRLQLGEDQS